MKQIPSPRGDADRRRRRFARGPPTGLSCTGPSPPPLGRVADGAIDPPSSPSATSSRAAIRRWARPSMPRCRCGSWSLRTSTCVSGSGGARPPCWTPRRHSGRTGLVGRTRRNSNKPLQAQRQPGFAHTRTTFRAADTVATTSPAINAALLCRDHLLGSLDDRSLRILKGLMSNRTKKELAAAEGISPSAVSQRASRDGLDLIVVASQYLRSLP